MSIYDAAGVISSADMTALCKFASDLVERITQWLEAEHPELMGG